MTLPASGPISIGMVAAELGIGLPLSLGDGRVRSLAGVPAPTSISLGNLYGKSTYTPMNVTASSGSGGPVSSDNSGGTVSGQASVSVTAGSGGYSFQWIVTSNPDGCTVGALTGAAVSASKTFAKLSNGSATVTFSITVTDNTGHTVTVPNVTIDLYWGSAV